MIKDSLVMDFDFHTRRILLLNVHETINKMAQKKSKTFPS